MGSCNKEHMAEDWKGGLQRHTVYDPYNKVMVKSSINQTG